MALNHSAKITSSLKFLGVNFDDLGKHPGFVVWKPKSNPLPADDHPCEEKRHYKRKPNHVKYR